MGRGVSLDARLEAFGLCGRHTSANDLRPALSGVRGERGGLTGGIVPGDTLTSGAGALISVR
jgi:hypothetical protein